MGLLDLYEPRSDRVENIILSPISTEVAGVAPFCHLLAHPYLHFQTIAGKHEPFTHICKSQL
jgi:hypothetical protein